VDRDQPDQVCKRAGNSEQTGNWGGVPRGQGSGKGGEGGVILAETGWQRSEKFISLFGETNSPSKKGTRNGNKKKGKNQKRKDS